MGDMHSKCKISNILDEDNRWAVCVCVYAYCRYAFVTVVKSFHFFPYFSKVDDITLQCNNFSSYYTCIFDINDRKPESHIYSRTQTINPLTHTYITPIDFNESPKPMCKAEKY